jgi:hypothetical protein
MPNRFSPRELLLISQLEQGSNSRQIAAFLGITEASAYVHRSRLRQKLRIFYPPDNPLARCTMFSEFLPVALRI